MFPARDDQPNYFPSPDKCSGEPLISMSEVVKVFKNAGGEFTALNRVTACFYAGEFVSVVGKSGSGKSTLVNMLTGIDHPTSGTVRVSDIDIHRLSENDMSVWRGNNLGIVFQFFQLLPTLTLLENVMLPMYLIGKYAPAEREERALRLLERVGLRGMEDKLPAAVSGGQQQSAAIARALANDPPIIIADEPTGNLDSRAAEEVFDLFTNLIDAGKTVLVVTHDISLAKRTSRTLLLSDGELINPWVAHALPRLAHSEMLWLTHHVQPVSYPAGALLPIDDENSEWLWLVTAGQIDLVEATTTGGGRLIASLPGGSFLAGREIQPGWLAHAGADRPLELLVVAGADFTHWCDQHPAVWTGLKQSRRLHPFSGGQ